MRERDRLIQRLDQLDLRRQAQRACLFCKYNALDANDVVLIGQIDKVVCVDGRRYLVDESVNCVHHPESRFASE